jgi:hypothetical protein
MKVVERDARARGQVELECGRGDGDGTVRRECGRSRRIVEEGARQGEVVD